jgi:hypothetical protein
LAHDAGELAAGLAELRLGLACEARVCTRAVQDEDPPDRLASELLADLVGLVEGLESLRDCPEVERARLDRQHGHVRGDGRALRDVAQARRPVEEDVVVAAGDLSKARQGDRPIGPHDGKAVERRTILARGAPVERARLAVHVDDERAPAVEVGRSGEVDGEGRFAAPALLLEHGDGQHGRARVNRYACTWVLAYGRRGVCPSRRHHCALRSSSRYRAAIDSRWSRKGGAALAASFSNSARVSASSWRDGAGEARARAGPCSTAARRWASLAAARALRWPCSTCSKKCSSFPQTKRAHA